MKDYQTAFRDHQYLWKEYGEAYDMTGGYVDSEDLAELLASPNKRTAARCLIRQIEYWFQVGPTEGANDRGTPPRILMATDPILVDIAERYGCRP